MALDPIRRQIHIIEIVRNLMPAEAGEDANDFHALTAGDPNVFKILSSLPPAGLDNVSRQIDILRAQMPAEAGEDPYDLNVPNLGSFNAFSSASVIGDFKVERWVGAGISPRSRTTSLTIATIGGKMRFNLIYWDSQIDESAIKEIASKAMNVLSEAIR